MTKDNKIEEYIANKRKEGESDKEIYLTLIQSGLKKDDLVDYFSEEVLDNNHDYGSSFTFAYGQFLDNFSTLLSIITFLTLTGFLFTFLLLIDLNNVLYWTALILLFICLTSLINIGFIKTLLNLNRKGSSEFKDFFKDLDLFPTMLAGSFLFFIIPLSLSSIPILIGGAFSYFQNGGFFDTIFEFRFLIAFFIYLGFTFRLFFFDFFIIDENSGVIESLKKSFAKTKGSKILFLLWKTSIALIPLWIVSIIFNYYLSTFELGIISYIPELFFGSIAITFLFLVRAYFYDQEIKNKQVE